MVFWRKNRVNKEMRLITNSKLPLVERLINDKEVAESLGKERHTRNSSLSMKRLLSVTVKVVDNKISQANKLENKEEAKAELDGAARLSDAFELESWRENEITYAKICLGFVEEGLAELYDTITTFMFLRRLMVDGRFDIADEFAKKCAEQSDYFKDIETRAAKVAMQVAHHEVGSERAIQIAERYGVGSAKEISDALEKKKNEMKAFGKAVNAA